MDHVRRSPVLFPNRAIKDGVVRVNPKTGLPLLALTDPGSMSAGRVSSMDWVERSLDAVETTPEKATTGAGELRCLVHAESLSFLDNPVFDVRCVEVGSCRGRDGRALRYPKQVQLTLVPNAERAGRIRDRELRNAYVQFVATYNKQNDPFIRNMEALSRVCREEEEEANGRRLERASRMDEARDLAEGSVLVPLDEAREYMVPGQVVDQEVAFVPVPRSVLKPAAANEDPERRDGASPAPTTGPGTREL